MISVFVYLLFTQIIYRTTGFNDFQITLLKLQQVVLCLHTAEMKQPSHL